MEGTTCGAGSDAADSACGPADGPDVVYLLNLTDAALLTFDTVGSDFDAVLRIAEARSCPGTELACDDDSSDVAAGRPADGD